MPTFIHDRVHDKNNATIREDISDIVIRIVIVVLHYIREGNDQSKNGNVTQSSDGAKRWWWHNEDEPQESSIQTASAAACLLSTKYYYHPEQHHSPILEQDE